MLADGGLRESDGCCQVTTALGLGVFILTFGPVSGAHCNPVVSLVDWVDTSG
jgi:glycerol uptake facilitator-like aquaporin